MHSFPQNYSLPLSPKTCMFRGTRDLTMLLGVSVSINDDDELEPVQAVLPAIGQCVL